MYSYCNVTLIDTEYVEPFIFQNIQFKSLKCKYPSFLITLNCRFLHGPFLWKRELCLISLSERVNLCLRVAVLNRWLLWNQFWSPVFQWIQRDLLIRLPMLLWEIRCTGVRCWHLGPTGAPVKGGGVFTSFQVFKAFASLASLLLRGNPCSDLNLARRTHTQTHTLSLRCASELLRRHTFQYFRRNSTQAELSTGSSHLKKGQVVVTSDQCNFIFYFNFFIVKLNIKHKGLWDFMLGGGGVLTLGAGPKSIKPLLNVCLAFLSRQIAVTPW